MTPRQQTLIAALFFLRCPACRQGTVPDGLFGVRERCAACGQSFELGPGEFLGGAYLNYGAAGILALIFFLALQLLTPLSDGWVLGLTGVFAVVFPCLTLRHTRALFTAIMYLSGALPPQGNPTP